MGISPNDLIGLDYDAPDFDKKSPEELAIVRANFLQVANNWPRNPLALPSNVPPEMPEWMRTLYSYCYTEVRNNQAIIPADAFELDIELLNWIRSHMKARIAIYDPLKLPIDLLQKMDLEQIYVHRSIIFIPTTQLSLEIMKHLFDDVYRRLDEMKMLFMTTER